MRRSRWLGVRMAGLGAACCLATACSSSRAWSIVALGDSVPHGTNCDCRPYPPLSADDLATRTGRSVTATNEAVAGASSADVLDQLTADHPVIDHVRTATGVEIQVGANDVAHSTACGTRVDCYLGRIPSLEHDLAAIVARVRELTSGRVVLVDYWSVWLGGRYATAEGPAYVDAARQLTERVDSVIKATATDSGSSYIDLRTAFKRPDYAYDETHFLSDDGDHPNAAGHEQIAKAIEQVLHSAGR